jgi:anti-sigma regulatory factor (Ser/Thr protein kinase)/GAF domain-containing protein
MGPAFGEGILAEAALPPGPPAGPPGAPPAAGPLGAPPPAGPGRLLAGGGEIAARLGRMDWSAHPLGPPPGWPPSLLNTLTLMLSSRAQMALFWGSDLHVFYNDALAPALGVKHPGSLAQPARDHYGELWGDLEPRLATVLRTGESVCARDRPFPLDRRGYPDETYFDVSYDPIRVADGTVSGVLCIVTESTGRVVGERRLRALADLGTRLADAADEAELARRTAQVLGEHPRDVPFALLFLPPDRSGDGLAPAAWCGVAAPDAPAGRARGHLRKVLADGSVRAVPTADFVADPPAGAADRALVLPVVAGARTVGALVAGVSLHRVVDRDLRSFLELVAAQISRAVGRQRAEERDRVRAADVRALTDSAVALATARTSAEVVRVAAEQARALARARRVAVAVSGARTEAGEPTPMPSEPDLIMPLTGAGGSILGRLDVWGEAGEPGGTLAQFARIVGLRLENVRTIEAEHRIAATLQHSLLPPTLPRVPGTELAGRYLPGDAEVDVGGDWYDAVALPDGRLALVIGDVAGRGVPAAATMGQVRNALRAYLLEGFAPGEALDRLNRLVLGLVDRSVGTVACGRYDPRDGELTLASAGHVPPLVVGPDGAAEYAHAEALGPPIGAVPGATFEQRRFCLEPGARLLLFTDGLVKHGRRGIDAGLRRLAADAGRPLENVAAMVERVVDRAARRARPDDVAVLALEAGEVDRLDLRLPANAKRLTLLRHRLEQFLAAHGVSEHDSFDLLVSVSEAAANAIEHPLRPTDPSVRVTVELDGGDVVVEVRDSGRWRPPTESLVRGRGLGLIGALMDLDIRHDDHGTVLTMRRRLQQPLSALRHPPSAPAGGDSLEA